MQDVTPTCVANAARGWIGTRFHHQGRLRAEGASRGGCDCIGLVVGVAAELGLRSRQGAPLAAWDQTAYGREPEGRRLQEALETHFWRVPKPRAAADILLLAIDGAAPRHVAIMASREDTPTLIHAYAAARGVVEHVLDATWSARIVATYRWDAFRTSS